MRPLVLTCLVLCAAGCDALRPVAQGAGPREVEAAVFEGGYGIHWHQRMAADYNARQGPGGVQVRLWGDPRVSEKIKPRLLRGDPPEMFLIADLPVWLLVAADKLLPFNAALEQPAPGADAPWRDLFIPGTLDQYTADGKVYGIPSAFGAYSCWYDARLFREHGWAPPATWDEFLALCDAIAAQGIAPLAFQGKYPIYAWWTLVPIIQRCGGLAAINRINALEPGAFQHPDVVRAAALLQDLATRHFQKGAMAMTHTESQLQFVNNQAAMIFCGLWLHNEMRASTAPDFEMRCFNVPAVPGGKGNPRLFSGSGWEFIFVPAESRNPEAVFDFIRFLVSPQNAPDMGRSIGVISPLRGGTPRDAVDPPLQSAIDLIEASEGIFSVRLETLLLRWREQVMQPAMAGLLRGEIAPGDFCRILDEGVAEALRAPGIVVPPAVQYDPARFGEAA
jgi:ABC-type glycerol-3-phosphate transport system substrate-binding protein